MLWVLITEAHEANKGEVGTIFAVVDVFECGTDAVFVNGALAEFEATELR